MPAVWRKVLVFRFSAIFRERAKLAAFALFQPSMPIDAPAPRPYHAGIQHKVRE